jgi:excisionase family DNA binding protein
MAHDDFTNDVLNGAGAIAAFLNQTARRTYHLLESGKLPAFKLGGRKWQARKSTLRRHIEALEAKSGGEAM